MAFLLSKNPFAAQLRSHFQLTGVQKSEDAISLSHRAFHVEPGAREKALLAEDPGLKRYKSHKKSLWRLKRFGDVMTIVVVAGCCYEIYVKTVMREEARGQAKAASGSA